MPHLQDKNLAAPEILASFLFWFVPLIRYPSILMQDLVQ
jgi:hypothetical protein